LAWGDVDSSGIIIFLSGKKAASSVAARHSSFIWAGRRFDPNARFTAGEIEAMAREDRLKDMQYASVVAESSLFLTSSDVLHHDGKKNTVLSPEELHEIWARARDSFLTSSLISATLVLEEVDITSAYSKLTTMTFDTSNRGFASMDEDEQREIASKGGKAAHEKGTAHEFEF
jgi:hypothetical protein